MKRLFGCMALFFAVFMYSQQNLECVNNLSIFVEKYKVKNYEGAYKPWKFVYDSCPDLNYAVYAYANKIVKPRIKKTTGDEQKAYIDLLLKTYVDGHKYFPKKVSYAEMKIDEALISYDEGLKTNTEVFELLDDAFQKDRQNFSKPRALLGYFYVVVDMYNAKETDLQKVFNVYDNVSERIEETLDKITKNNDALILKKETSDLTPKEKRRMSRNGKLTANFEKIISSIEIKLGSLADCENLIPLYKKNLEAKKSDTVWLRRAAARMDDKGCTGDPLFVEIVEALHKLNPSSNSAYYLGLLNDKSKNTKEAMAYYNEALNLEQDNLKKAKIALKIGAKSKANGQLKTSYSYLNKALKYSPSLGEAYLIMASIYADSANDCGSTTFEKRAMYWKAAEVARKAGKVKHSLSEKAEKTYQSYNKRAPSKSDIFESGLTGQSIEFNCWIGGKITVPKL